MAIELSSLIFTNKDDIVPLSGTEQILALPIPLLGKTDSPGLVETDAGDDTIVGKLNHI